MSWYWWVPIVWLGAGFITVVPVSLYLRWQVNRQFHPPGYQPPE